jgi:choline kinase
MPRIRQLIILAAGTGTRLRPLTDDRPKCLVPLLGRPLLEWQIDVARDVGLDKIVLVGGHRADRLSDYGLTTVINPDFERTNMVHSLFAARDHFDDGFALAYGDIVYRPSLMRTVLDSAAPIAVAVDLDWRAYWAQRFNDPLSDAETLRIGPQGTISDIGRKATSYQEIEGQYVGVLAFDSEGVRTLIACYDQLREDHAVRLGGRPLAQCFMTDLLQHMAHQGIALTPAFVRGGWVEIDSSSDLELAERLARSGRLEG